MKFITYMTAALIAWPIIAWEFMLAVGVAHLHWWPALPVVGYPTALLVTFLLFSMMSGGTMATAVYGGKR